MPLEASPRPSEELQRHWLFLHHTVAINDLIGLLFRLVRTTPGLCLADLRTDRNLRHSAAYRGPRPLIPDLWVDLRQGNRQTCLAFEVDRGTMGPRAMQRKLAAWLAFRGAAGQDRLRLLLQVGVLGGFTTFSAFSLDLAVMIERPRPKVVPGA